MYIDILWNLYKMSKQKKKENKQKPNKEKLLNITFSNYRDR